MCLAGFAGVFAGMAMLYLGIRLTALLVARATAGKSDG